MSALRVYLKAQGHLGTILILLLYLALVPFYALKTPIFLKPDEALHFAYVRYLKVHHSLPVVNSSYSGIEGRPYYEPQSHQPPLYHALMALITLWDDMNDAQELYRLNPHYLSTEQGNKNPFAPGRSRSEVSFYLGRFISSLFGAIAVVTVYLMAREFAPKGAAMIAMAIMAFNPQFLFISTYFSNDASVIALITLGLWQATRILKTGFTIRHAIPLGITIGLATLFKTSGLLLVIVIPFALMWRVLANGELKGEFGGALTSLALSLAIPSPRFWHNWLHYGDPLGYKTFHILMPREAPFSFSTDIGRFLSVTWRVYWLDFSPGGILFADRWVYLVLAFFAGWGIVGVLIAIARRADLRPYMGLFALWVATLFLSILVLTIRFDHSVESGRWLLPASPVIAILLALGIWELIPHSLRRFSTSSISALWGCFATFALLFYLLPNYSPPPTYPSERDLEIPNLTFVSMEGKAAIIGHEIDQQQAYAGDEVEVIIYWKALEAMEEDYSVFVQFVPVVEGLGGESKLDTYPGMGLYPTSRWRKGEVVKDSYLLRVPQALSTPIRCRVIAGMYDFSTRARLEAHDSQGNELAPPILSHIALRPVEPLETPSEAKLPQPVDFGGKISLVGRETQRVDHKLKVILWWRSEGEAGKDYTVFVHLRGEDGAILAQGDGPPMQNGFPSSLWRRGDIMRDEHVIELPPDLAEEAHSVAIGLYDPETMVRLTALENGQRLPDDAFVIQLSGGR